MCSRLEREASRQEDTRTVPVESRCLMMRLMRQQMAVAMGKPSAAAGKIYCFCITRVLPPSITYSSSNLQIQ